MPSSVWLASVLCIHKEIEMGLWFFGFITIYVRENIGSNMEGIVDLKCHSNILCEFKICIYSTI